MTQHEEHMHTSKPVYKTALSHMEREEMRRSIRTFMAEHPVRPTFRERFSRSGVSSTPTYYFRPALAGLLIFVLVGGGTSYAAADALPGDLLYPVKTAVNEGVQEAFAFSGEAKAILNAKLAVRRLEEAETLASEGRLSSKARVDIEARFEKHAEKFEATVMALAEKDDAIEAAADAQSNLEASLKVHAAVLADLAFSARESVNEISPIALTVEKRVRSVESARVATEQTISRKVGKGIETAAAEKKRTAERSLSSRELSRVRAPQPAPEAATMSMMAVVADDASATTSDDAQDEFNAGSEKFEEGKYGEAFTRFQNAIRALKKEKLESEVRKKLNIEQVPFFREISSEEEEFEGGPEERREEMRPEDVREEDESREVLPSLPVLPGVEIR